MVRETGWSQTWVIAALSLGLLTSGLVSPAVGRRIERFGGRPVLAASAVLLAIGLLIQASGAQRRGVHRRVAGHRRRHGRRVV